MAQGTPVGDDWVAKQLEKYGVNFDEADTDKNGSLRFREIVAALVKGGFRGGYREAKRIFTELDVNSDKAISRQEFLNLVKAMPTKELKEMTLRREFKIIDADGSGDLTRKEIADAIGNADLNAEAENMSNLLIALVKDDDNKLNYEEFLEAWKRQPKKIKVTQGTPVGDDWVAKQLEKYGVNFDEADTDKNGSLKFQEIVAALVKGGFQGSDDEAKRIFTELDVNSDKAISRQEFLRLVKAMPTEEIKEMTLRREFKIIDADGSGDLTRKEIGDAIGNADLNAEAENMSNLLIALVRDDDNKLNYEEFIKAWKGQAKKK